MNLKMEGWVNANPDEQRNSNRVKYNINFEA